MAAAPVLALYCATAGAADPFSVQIDINGNVTSHSFKRFDDVLNTLETTELSSLNPSYTGVEAGTLTINMRGLPLVTSYPTAGSPQLVFSVPSLGITQTFNGATRDQSEDLLDEYITSNADGILDRLFRELARVSPVDPIAGNPNSLMSQIVAFDFATGVSAFTGGRDDSSSENLVGVGLRVGSFSQQGIRSNTYTLPLSYTMRADLDPRRQVTFHLPITYIDVSGAKAYSVAPGIAYRHPVNDNWTLTPSLSVGITGSEDLASLGAIAAVSLTSAFIFSARDIDFTVGNMIGHYRTISIGSGDYAANPGIRNTVFKNGISASMPVNTAGQPMSVELGYAHTHFSGTALFAENYHELSINIGTNRSARSARTYYRAGAAYVRAGESKGFNVNVGFWF